MVGRADVAHEKFDSEKQKKKIGGKTVKLCSSMNRKKKNFFFFFLRAMLPKSLEQVNAPTSEAGGIETPSQGDTYGYKSGVCPVATFLTRLMPQKKLCPVTNYII